MSKVEISVQSSKIAKVRIIIEGVDRIKNIFCFFLLTFISIGFLVVGFKQLFLDIPNRLDDFADIENGQIIVIICNISMYLFVVIVFVPVIHDLKDSFHTIINNGDIYELNKEKNAFIINNKIECLITDMEKVHLRIVHSKTGKDYYRLYYKTTKRRKRLICQDNDYEMLRELSDFIGEFLSIPVAIK